MKLNRRQATTLLVTAAALPSAKARAPGPPVRVAEAAALAKVGQDAEFRFEGEACVAVRVPLPDKPGKRLNVVANGPERWAIAAYSRACTHLGCKVSLPDGTGTSHCSCHGSGFDRAGEVLAGPAPRPLRAIRVELRDDALYAVSWLEA